MLGVTIKHNSSLQLVIPVLPSSISHALEFSQSCPLEYLSVSTYCMQTWREFDRICVEKTIAAFLPVFTRAERTWAFAKLGCFDTVFQRPYRYFSIDLKVVFSFSDRYEIFANNWLWIEISENVVLSKIDITMTTINKNL